MASAVKSLGLTKHWAGIDQELVSYKLICKMQGHGLANIRNGSNILALRLFATRPPIDVSVLGMQVLKR